MDKSFESLNASTLQVPGRPRSKSMESVASNVSSVSSRGQPVAIQAKEVSLTLLNGLEPVSILNQLNLNVEVGTIYGLLGPSGCGKTSFLRCLIGFQKISSGQISVFGYPPKDERSGVPGRGLGYMPQDLALHEYLTIEELLTYYGNLYLIDSDVLSKRIDRLIQSLDLPEKERLVINLSGGQRRRVSFALTIVHKPRLLILDEPTVGCDPILRERIWESLEHFSSADRITVIITTHYIEEARRSHRVGFMRAGSILVEDSPEDLMRQMNSDTLERVFLTLVQTSAAQSKALQGSSSSSSAQASSLVPLPVRSRLSDVSAISIRYQEPMPRLLKTFEARAMLWYYMLIVVIKNVAIQIKRTPTTIIVQFVIPLISITVFCMLIGQIPHSMKFGVINRESPANLSNLFVDSVNKYVLNMVPMESAEKAHNDSKSRHLIGWMEIPSNFSQALTLRYRTPELFTNETKLDSTIKLHLDVANWPLMITIERAFEQAFFIFAQKMIQSFGKNPAIARIPIDIPEVIYGSADVDDYSGFREFVSVGILVIMSYTIAFGATILVVLLEKISLIFERNYAAGVTTTQLIFGHLIVRVVVQSFVVTILFFIILTLFEVPQRGSYFTAIALLCVHSVTGSTHGIFTSAISNSLFMSSVFSNAVLIFFFVIGGVLWPYNSLPYYLQWVAVVSPICLPTESLRGVLVRGWSITHPTVLIGFVVSFGWSAVFLAGSLYFFRYGISNAKG